MCLSGWFSVDQIICQLINGTAIRHCTARTFFRNFDFIQGHACALFDNMKKFITGLTKLDNWNEVIHCLLFNQICDEEIETGQQVSCHRCGN